MRCPTCSGATRVSETRQNGAAVRRRRTCGKCGGRFTTYERAEAPALGVRKRSGAIEPFDHQKLMAGLARAATKRPVTITQLEELVAQIERAARDDGATTTAERIGELALRGLKELDQVAYIRFASVYREFSDVGEFEAELARLAAEPALRGEPATPVENGATGTFPSDRSGIFSSYPTGPGKSPESGRFVDDRGPRQGAAKPSLRSPGAGRAERSTH